MPTLLEDRVGDEIGLSVKFLEGDLENPAAWRFGDVVAEAVIVAIGAGGRMNTIDCLRDLENAWREELATFLSQLNQEILAVARSLGGLNVKRYNFFANPDLKVATYRRQAAMAMPLLVQQLCDNIDPTMAPLLGAIDEGKPLFKLLANRLQVQPSVLKTPRNPKTSPFLRVSEISERSCIFFIDFERFFISRAFFIV